ncbi:MAG: tRNA (adenosine(37)-N6)-dimethylallyltransferase MiaA [Acidobacteriota bacterium]
MKNIIQVLGPTGIGKSSVSVCIAKEINGEIISADSIQVYEDFNIGTAKINEEDKNGIYHHLIDILKDCSQFNVTKFLELSHNISENLIKEGKIPVICGGTALYLGSMINGIFPENKNKRISREKLKKIGEKSGYELLWNKLNHIDPAYAIKIGKNDRIRIIRGLEIFYNNGIPPSSIFKRTVSSFNDYNFIRIGLILPRDRIYEKINNRVDKMIKRGLIEETKYLKDIYGINCPPFKSIGYKEILMYFDKKMSEDQAVELIKQHSRNYAKRQLTWFRKEKDINWFGPDDIKEILKFIKEKLSY